MEVSHFKVSTHISEKVPFLDQVLQGVEWNACSLSFLHNWWSICGSLQCSIKDGCKVLTPYLFTKGRWRSVVLKFQLIFSKSTIFGWSAAVCHWNAAVIIFYIIDGHLWSLQCSVVIHVEFVHHIYLLKVDGGLSF